MGTMARMPNRIAVTSSRRMATRDCAPSDSIHALSHRAWLTRSTPELLIVAMPRKIWRRAELAATSLRKASSLAARSTGRATA